LIYANNWKIIIDNLHLKKV